VIGPSDIFSLKDELLSRGLVTEAQIREAMAHQAGCKRPLQDVLVDLGMVSEDDIFRIIAEKTQLPTVNPLAVQISPEAIKRVPYKMTQRYNIVPLKLEGDTLTVAMSNPLDLIALDDLGKVTGCRIQPVLAKRSQISEAVEHAYGMENAAYDLLNKVRPPEDVEVVLGGKNKKQGESGKREEEDLPDAPIIRLCNMIITDAIQAGASDIHIEPAENEVILRYRVDGVLRDIMNIPAKLHRKLVSRVKIMTGTMDIAERRKPQDGRARVVVGNRQVDLRISTLPTYFGEKVVIRILDPKAAKLDLEELGFEPPQLEKFKALISRSQGMVLVTGPTGSGKTTTLYAALHAVKSRAKNIITLEEPVEYILEGINQVEVNERAGVRFSTGLRSILRQDPDIILVGEIRDGETAKIAVEAAMTGHLLLSTLHTNSAAAAIPRLIDLGVEPYLAAASLSGVLAQRLLRRICPDCRVEYEPDGKERGQIYRLYPDLAGAKFYRGEGCSQCDFTGYKGRVAAYEVLTVTDSIRALITKGAPEEVIEREAVREGMQLMIVSGLKKAAEGVTTLEEVKRVLLTERAVGLCPSCKLPVSLSLSRCPSCGAQLDLGAREAEKPALQPAGEKPSQEGNPPQKAEEEPAETPAAEPQPSPAEPGVAEAERDRPRVLIADDDGTTRRLLARVLRKQGWEVIEAADGRQALERIFRMEPDLVILDVMMPKMDGYEVCRKMRSSLRTGRIPVIMLTAKDDLESELEGLDAGADDYMTKPVNPLRLLAHCKMLLAHDQTATRRLPRRPEVAAYSEKSR